MSALRIFAGLCVGLTLAMSASAFAEDSSLAESHDLAKEGGRLCMSNHGHTGSGTGATKPAARAAAIRSWAEFTNFEYGRAWASFSAAAGSSTRYTKEASGWSADVDARPCKR
jgi:hypothetical protein